MSIIQGNAHTSAGGYQIERSLRFNSADSAYLNRTPASAGNRRTYTFSAWVKRSALGQQVLFSGRVGTSQSRDAIRFDSDHTLQFDINDLSQANLKTTQVFRDISAWYHVIVAVDTTQATSSNRVKMYVNGSQITAFGTATYPTQNLDGNINTAQPHGIGVHIANPQQYYSGYMTEVNFIDGQALTPSDFGETDSATGVWKPKAYTGTYGTNGFFLKFADNSGTTSTTLGKDSSGNANNWTPNNFSVTAGSGNDSMVDSPTSYGTDTGVGGEVRGNYCTLNPMEGVNSAGSLLGVFSNGNLDYSCSASAGNAPRMSAFSTLHLPSSGKWYCEFSNVSNREIGIIQGSVNQAGVPLQKYIIVYSGGADVNNGSVVSGSTFSFSSTDIIGIAYSADAGTLTFYKNGTQQLVYGSITTSIDWCFGSTAASSGSNSTFTANFGQRAFAYTAPSGFKALCTQNLPTPTIGATSTTQANDYMNVVLYTGTGATRSITGVGFQPDFVWNKCRSAARGHALYDVIRGVTKGLASNTTGAEYTESGLTAFNSDGFSLGSASTDNNLNDTFVSWNWKANGAGSSNTAGTITSTVSANTTSGFSIVTYTGNGTAGATVGHGLGVAPGLIFLKERNVAGDSWPVYHSSLSSAQYLILNTTGAAATSATLWGNNSSGVAPTSTVFTIGSNSAINENTSTFVAYCFAPVAGYSAFGSYTGNGSTDGPFVYTGFRPRYVLIKDATNSATEWGIEDTVRDTDNPINLILQAETSAAEATATNRLDILSNGFKIRSTGFMNTNNATIIYAAFAETPAKFSLAR